MNQFYGGTKINKIRLFDRGQKIQTFFEFLLKRKKNYLMKKIDQKKLEIFFVRKNIFFRKN